MFRSQSKGNWLEQVAELLGGGRACERRPIRRLAAERLERRNVLCTTAVALAPATVTDETNLAELYEQAAAMGPAQPAIVVEGSAAVSEDSTAAQDNAASDPGFADQYFTNYVGQGAGEGEGGSSGSGSGGGSVSGSGGGECSGSGSGGGEGSGSGSGGGEGSGSGSGGGEGSGSGIGSASGSGSSVVTDEPPDVSANFDPQNDTITISGQVTNDGAVGGLIVSFEGLYSGTVMTDANGCFTIQITRPADQGTITYSVTDDHGLTSDIGSWNYPG